MCCVIMVQLWARGARHHLLSSVAPTLDLGSLLHQLPVHLLPAPTTAAHDLLLREDSTGSASSGEAGELTANMTLDCCVVPVAFRASTRCVCESDACVPRSAGSADPQLSGGKAVSSSWWSAW